MAQFVNIYDVDLQQRNDPLPLRSIIGEGDANGLRVGARVFDGGEPVTLGGQCVGKVIRADGSTVPLTGTVADNSAYVVLDQTSCAVEGPVQVAVMWVSGTNVTTLVVAYGTVVNTQTGTIIEPGEPIPDITELLAEIEAMREATAAANAAATAANAAAQHSVRYDTEQSLAAYQQRRACKNIDAVNASELLLYTGGADLLSGITPVEGYYDSTGALVSDSTWASYQNITYDPAKRYVFNTRPVIAAFDASDNLVHYSTAVSSYGHYTLPVWADVSYFHMSVKTSLRLVRGYAWPQHFSRWDGLRCLIYGDSIARGLYTYNTYVPRPFIELAANMNGITTITNNALGGASYCTGTDAAYSIWEDELNDGDPPTNTAELVVVHCGTNDWGHNSPIGTFGDTATTTFYGAVYATLELLRRKNTIARVIATTPLPRGSGNAMEIALRENSAGYTMQDYADAIIKVCESLSIECIPGAEFSLHPLFTPNYYYTDKLHPIQSGHDAMALVLAQKIALLSPKYNMNMAM